MSITPGGNPVCSACGRWYGIGVVHVCEETPLAVAPNSGQVWSDRTTGERFVILGRKTKGWLLAPVGGTGADALDPVADLKADYDYVSCNHEDYCCTSHRTHTMPHRGCVLR